jgi:hypothetical protein
LAALVLLSLGLVLAGRWILHHSEYAREQRAGYESVLQLRERRPADVSPDTWEWATNWAITAYANVCFSPEHVSLEELKRFRADLEERLRGPVNLGTVDWIWQRLGQTGPHGLSYQQRFEPQYREGLEVAKEGRRADAAEPGN